MNRWKLYKGETVTTYGGSYKFKNGKHYFRVAGPRKQYIKSYNLGPVVKVNTIQGPSNNTSSNLTSNNKSNATTPTSSEETTVTTVTVDDTKVPIFTFNGNNTKPILVKYVLDNAKFIVDYLETGTRANKVADYIGQFGGNQGIYRIKGTNDWIYSMSVKTNKTILSHYYDYEHFSLIKFTKDTDIYTSNGEKINFNGDHVRKQSGEFKVDKLLYIWIPSENQAELFYHMVGKSAEGHTSELDFDDGYVKANDVTSLGVKLIPANTPEEAQAAALKK